jgi:predicted transcriptional regulator
MNTKRFFSPSEWEVLQFVTERHPITAREVADHFAETRQWARTTVLTLLERLRDKGYLKRDESGSVHLFSPSAPKPDLMSSVVRDFVQKALGGSLSPFMAYLGNEANLSPEEVAELRRIVKSLDEGKESGYE